MFIKTPMIVVKASKQVIRTTFVGWVVFYVPANTV